MIITEEIILFFSKTIITVFVGVLFTQSGLDKVFNFNGNLSYIKSVFEKTVLSSTSSLLFIIITLIEVSAGAICLMGSALLIVNNQSDFTITGLFLSAISILFLFTGQRIAKDYAGASSLVSYFILILLGLFLFTVNT